MKFILCLAFLFSSLAFAGFEDDKNEIVEFCKNHINDSKKFTKGADGSIKLTPDYVKLLNTNEKELNLLMVCNVNRYFWMKFPKTYQASFEKTAKKKLTTSDLDKLSDKLLEMVYNDTHANRLQAFNSGEAGVEKYSDAKMAEFAKKNK